MGHWLLHSCTLGRKNIEAFFLFYFSFGSSVHGYVFARSLICNMSCFRSEYEDRRPPLQRQRKRPASGGDTLWWSCPVEDTNYRNVFCY